MGKSNLETKNLMIRESEFRDCEFFAEWEKSPKVTKYLAYDSDRNYETVVREFVLDSHNQEKLQFTVIAKADDRPIGRIHVTRVDRRNDSLDVTKFYIAEDVENREQTAEEALRRFLEYAFINLHMERITLDYFLENRLAAHLYEQIGFSSEGVMRNAVKKDGRYYDLHLMSVLRADYYDKIKDR